MSHPPQGSPCEVPQIGDAAYLRHPQPGFHDNHNSSPKPRPQPLPPLAARLSWPLRIQLLKLNGHGITGL